jgi:serine/threonine protein kinase
VQNHAELTAQVGTRLYRAPEIIFLDRNYGKPADVWSCGVVMADLFKHISSGQAGPIFGGLSVTHCFPISNPNGAAYLEEDLLPCTQGHVLDSIFNLIGSPNHLDTAFIDDTMAL